MITMKLSTEDSFMKLLIEYSHDATSKENNYSKYLQQNM